jgi:hypothetical protein
MTHDIMMSADTIRMADHAIHSILSLSQNNYDTVVDTFFDAGQATVPKRQRQATHATNEQHRPSQLVTTTTAIPTKNKQNHEVLHRF